MVAIIGVESFYCVKQLNFFLNIVKVKILLIRLSIGKLIQIGQNQYGFKSSNSRK